MNPEVQRRAQEEIDRVIGATRLPDHGDRSRLPYIEAIYRELLRHDPPLPIGVPHSLTEGDFLKDISCLKVGFFDLDIHYDEPSCRDHGFCKYMGDDT